MCQRFMTDDEIKGVIIQVGMETHEAWEKQTTSAVCSISLTLSQTITEELTSDTFNKYRWPGAGRLSRSTGRAQVEACVHTEIGIFCFVSWTLVTVPQFSLIFFPGVDFKLAGQMKHERVMLFWSNRTFSCVKLLGTLSSSSAEYFCLEAKG